MTVTVPLPELAVLAVGAALIIVAATTLLTRSWHGAALHRRSWMEHTVKPQLRWWAHNLLAHPLLVICPPLGDRLHDATIPDEEDR